MSCTVLIGTRDHYRACGLGTAETCRAHRVSLYPVPRTRDELPDSVRGRRNIPTRSPGPGAVSELGASRTSRASDDSGSDYGTFTV